MTTFFILLYLATFPYNSRKTYVIVMKLCSIEPNLVANILKLTWLYCLTSKHAQSVHTSLKEPGQMDWLVIVTYSFFIT